MKRRLAWILALVVVFVGIVAWSLTRRAPAPPSSAPALAAPRPAPTSPPIASSLEEQLSERDRVVQGLESRGYVLKQAPTSQSGPAAYAVKGLATTVLFHERDERLTAIEALLPLAGTATDQQEIDFASHLGNVFMGVPDDICRRSIQRVTTKASKGPTLGPVHSTFRHAQGFKVETTRSADGRYSLLFRANPAMLD